MIVRGKFYKIMCLFAFFFFFISFSSNNLISSVFSNSSYLDGLTKYAETKYVFFEREKYKEKGVEQN